MYVAVSNSGTPVQGIGDGNNCSMTMIGGFGAGSLDCEYD